MSWFKTSQEQYAKELIDEIDIYLDSMTKDVKKEHHSDYFELINDNIKNIDTILPQLSNRNLIARLTEQRASLTVYLQRFRGGNGKTKIKKIDKKVILGKERCIYTKLGDRKEYLKYKGELITVKDFKKIKTGLIR